MKLFACTIMCTRIAQVQLCHGMELAVNITKASCSRVLSDPSSSTVAQWRWHTSLGKWGRVCPSPLSCGSAYRERSLSLLDMVDVEYCRRTIRCVVLLVLWTRLRFEWWLTFDWPTTSAGQTWGRKGEYGVLLCSGRRYKWHQTTLFRWTLPPRQSIVSQHENRVFLEPNQYR